MGDLGFFNRSMQTGSVSESDKLSSLLELVLDLTTLQQKDYTAISITIITFVTIAHNSFIGEMGSGIRGHFQTSLGKINVIITFGGRGFGPRC